MKAKYLYPVLIVFIFTCAVFFRFYHFTARTPFDWDQNRDYTEITKISHGKVTLIGPVAKGEGGFFLGPLYYYLALPAYLLTNRNPVSLPMTSILFDLAAIAFVLICYPRRLGKFASLAIAAIWSFSWFAIETSRISWNVALVPLWSVVFFYLLSDPQAKKPLQMLIFGFWAGLAWHIHAALIPLALFASIFRWRDIRSYRHILYYFLGYAIPLLPLIYFDIRHDGMERILMLEFIRGNRSAAKPLLEAFNSVISRLGKNTYSIFFGSSDLHPLWGAATLLLGIGAVLRGQKIFRVAGGIILINFVLAVLLRDTGIPEYYLAASYLATVVIVVGLLTHFTRLRYVLLPVFLVISLFLSLRHWTVGATPFSLQQKMSIARKMVSYGEPLIIHTDLPFGRDSGIGSLVSVYGGSIARTTGREFLITDKVDVSVFYAGEIYETVDWYGGLRLARRN